MFEIYNDEGCVQVSSDNAYNLALDSVYILKGNSDQWGNGEFTPPTDKLYALQPTSEMIAHTFIGELKIKGGKGAKVYTFCEPKKGSSDEYGIEVYDEHGKLTFANSYLNLNVIDHVKIESSNSNKYTRDYGTTNIAVIPNKVTSAIWRVEHIGFFISTAWWFESGQLCFANTQVSSAPVLDYNIIQSDDIDFLVIDTSFY